MSQPCACAADALYDPLSPAVVDDGGEAAGSPDAEPLEALPDWAMEVRGKIMLHALW